MPGKVVAKLVGHTNADVTLNVYMQVMDDSLRTAVDRIGKELFTIVHSEPEAQEPTPRKDWLAALDDFRNWLIREAA